MQDPVNHRMLALLQRRGRDRRSFLLGNRGQDGIIVKTACMGRQMVNQHAVLVLTNQLRDVIPHRAVKAEQTVLHENHRRCDGEQFAYGSQREDCIQWQGGRLIFRGQRS